MNYRQELYSEYISTHTFHLYGEVDLAKTRKSFPAWNKYYGRHLPEDKNIKILETGCGNGCFLYYLKKLGYEDCSGIDISEQQIETAVRLGIKNVAVADLVEFLRDKKPIYDVIFARDVLEHFKKEEILEVTKFVYNSLRAKGRFVMQSPNAEGPLGARYRYGDFTHEIAFTRSSLAQVLRAAGFEQIGFFPTGPVVRRVKSAARFILWRLIRAFLKFYMLVETGSYEGIFTQNLIAVAKK